MLLMKLRTKGKIFVQFFKDLEIAMRDGDLKSSQLGKNLRNLF